MQVVKLDTGMDIFTLIRVSHIHLFGMTFIFLKDEHGDRAMQVWSPSSLWGDRVGRIVTALLVAAGNIAAIAVMNGQVAAAVLFTLATVAAVPTIMLNDKPERLLIPGTYVLYAAFATMLQLGILSL